MNTLIRKYRALLVAGTIIIAFLLILQCPKLEINPSFNDYSFVLLENELYSGTGCFKIKVESPDEKGFEISDASIKMKNLLVFETYDIRDNLVIVGELSGYNEGDNSSVKIFQREIRVKNRKTGKNSNMIDRKVDYIRKVKIEDFQITPAAS